MKRFLRAISIMVISSLLITTLSLFTTTTVYAGGDETAEVLATTDQLNISAKSGILMDAYTGKILYEKNSHEKLPLASVTKIMTLLLVMEAIEDNTIAITDTVTASAHACSMGGSQIWLKEGEEMTVDQLLKATCIASANDAAMVLAELVGDSQDGFVLMMNQKAQELNMKDTTFLNPTGLDEAGHLSSSYDIAIMSRELTKHKIIQEYTTIWMDSLRDGKTELVNTNKLVRFYKGATGLKTGTTNGAGSCISATASRGDMDVIAVVMGCTTSKERFADATRMLDYGFSHFTMYKPTTMSDKLPPVTVIKGVEPTVELCVTIDEKIIIPVGKQKAIVEEITVEDYVEAPITAGQKLGEVTILIDGNLLNTYDITAKVEVKKMTFSGAFGKLISSLIDM